MDRRILSPEMLETMRQIRDTFSSSSPIAFKLSLPSYLPPSPYENAPYLFHRMRLVDCRRAHLLIAEIHGTNSRDTWY